MGLELPQFSLGLNQEKLSEMSVKASVNNRWVKKKRTYIVHCEYSKNKLECSSLGFIGVLRDYTPCIFVFTALSPQPWELCEALYLVILFCRP